MQSIAALVAGVRGGELGQASIYTRGSSSLATIYSDYKGQSPLAQPVSLDSNGGAVVYVNQEVDVRVTDASGAVVRSFTPMETANSVEYIGASFTGNNYDSGASATGQPTTVQAILDGWFTSAGQPDFYVLFGGVKTKLQDALGGIAGIFFNVQAPAYGAKGDSATDDTTAIQNALNAASATKGIVFFPAGGYRITDKLTIPSGVSLWGSGSAGCAIRIDHATRDTLYFSGAAASEVRGIALNCAQANNGVLVHGTNATPARLTMTDCLVGDTNHTGNAIQVDGATPVYLDRCTVRTGTSGDMVSVNIALSRLYARACFFLVTGGAFTGNCVKFNSGVLEACVFDCSGVTSGTYACILGDGSVSTLGAGSVGNEFYPGSGTSSAVSLSSVNNASTVFAESGSIIHSGFTFPFVGTAIATNNPQIQTTWRDGKVLNTTDNSATVELGGLFYGTVIITRTAAGAGTQTVTSAAFAPPGAILTVVVYNNSGGVLAGDTVFGTGFYAGSANMTKPANGKISTQTFRMVYAAGTGAWVPVAAAVTSI